MLILPQLLLIMLLLFALGSALLQSLGYMPVVGLKTLSLDYYRALVERPQVLKALLFTLRYSALSAILATALGTLLALGLTRASAAWQRLVYLPILAPYMVAAALVMHLFAQGGIFSRIAGQLGLIGAPAQFPLLVYDQAGIGMMLALLWKQTPFIAMFVFAIVSRISTGLGEAAATLGASSLQRLCHVTLPLAMPTILSGFLILFCYTLGDYTIPLLLGPTVPNPLSILAYQTYIHPDLKMRPLAMAINMCITLLSLIAAGLYAYLLRRSEQTLGGERDA